MTIVTFDDARSAVAAGMLAAEAAKELVAGLTHEERLWCLDGDAPTWAGLKFLSDDGYHKAPFVAAEIDRVGLPGIRFSDGPRGAVVGNATCFPVSMARGATWDPDLEERVGEAIGTELRAIGANLTGAVCVNLLRHPAWGRAQETFGEDPHHVGEMGAALTLGLQRHVMANVKHFACNSMENARFTVDIEIDDVALHEVYLPHFRRIIDEGVASVMSAYNSVNGEWVGQNRALLTDVLRGEWGFEGFVISDWIFGLRDAATSVRAGLDIEMPYRMVRSVHLPGAIERGEVTWDEIDSCVERTVGTLLRFDAVLSAPSPSREALGAPAHRLLAREVAARSVVVLRNEIVDGERALPMVSTASIAVIGHLASVVNVGDGGSSDVWDLECRTVLDGLGAAFDHVTFDDGADLTRAAAAAANATAAIVVVGYTFADEGEYIGETDRALMSLFPPSDEPDIVDLFEGSLECLVPIAKPDHLSQRPKMFSRGGDRTSLRLSPDHVALITAVAAVNTRTIVVIQAGSAVIVTEWIDSVSAVVQAWYGGCEAGPGLADVLLGVVNPSARLPFSVPVDEAHLPVFDANATTFTYDRWHGWWHLANQGTAPAFPFGFGLSYTAFNLTDVDVAINGDALTVTGSIRNIGDRDGADVVQVYVELPDPNAPARLVAFARREVKAGGAEKFDIVVPLEKFATRDPVAKKWRAPVGVHRVIVGQFAGDPDAVAVTVSV